MPDVRSRMHARAWHEALLAHAAARTAAVQRRAVWGVRGRGRCGGGGSV
jgi:hypothetical protein